MGCLAMELGRMGDGSDMMDMDMVELGMELGTGFKGVSATKGVGAGSCIQYRVNSTSHPSEAGH